MATTRYIWKAIADEKALALFDTIARAECGECNESLIKIWNSLGKMLYMRLSRSMNLGLISSMSGEYSLTLLGNIVYHAQLTIDHAVNIYLRFKAVDLLEKSSDIPVEERTKTINFLLDNDLIKNIFF